ncbi:MAG: replicative DNA helicase [Desulfobacteraceae bacterium]|nr:replicative DNA helicase [Desulfobacteraceae bacterium]
MVPAPSAASSALSRLPPQNIEAEQGVLGSLLLAPGAIDKVADLLKPDDFYRPAHQTIFGAMLTLFSRTEPLDLVTVANQLQAANRLEEIGGAAYLAGLADIVPVASNITHYARIVRDKSVLRQLIKATSEIAGRCYEEQDEIELLLDGAEQRIFDISSAKSNQAFAPMGEVVKAAFAYIEKLAERQEHITGVPSGYDDFDKLTAGLQPSDLIIVAGRPSMGKTAFAMNLVQNAALLFKTPAAVFSLEMAKEQLAMRMLCSISRVDSSRLRTGRLSEHDWPKLVRATGMLAKAPIFIDDTPAISVLEMRAKTRRLKSEHHIGLVVVDYLQLMRGQRHTDSREQEISEISRSLKAMAKELHLPVIALSQLNRSLESRTDKRPQLSDLRESGAIEQDADVICFIYRDEVYNKSPDNPRRGIAEVIIGKQRNGPIGTVELAFLNAITTFEPLARQDYQPPPVNQ